MTIRNFALGLLSLSAVCASAWSASAGPRFEGEDFGALRDQLLTSHAMQLFGIVQPVGSASTRSIKAAEAEANPLALVTLARGLNAKVVSASADLGANIDMMTLFPAENPTHIIACNEQGTSQPAVQRIRLSGGSVETILTGMQSCDPAHITPCTGIILLISMYHYFSFCRVKNC